jgi:hypothetical protein
VVVILEELIKSGFENLKVNFDTRVIPLDYSKSYEKHLSELIADFS